MSPHRLRRLVLPIALVALAPLALVACGDGSDATDTGTGSPTKSDGTTFDVSMTDNEFTPNVFTVESGTAITFHMTNDGTETHEAVIGTAAEQAAHEEMMSEMTTSTTAGGGSDDQGSDGDTTTTTEDDMGGMHHLRSHDSDLPGVTVEPGQTKDLVYIFDAPGTVLIGCHEAGHYDDGMKATVTVT